MKEINKETYDKLIETGKELEQISHIKLEKSETSNELEEMSRRILILCIKLKPENPEPYKWLGYNYLHANDLEEAKKVFQKGEELAKEKQENPERFTYALGNVYRRMEDFERSINSYKKAIEEDKDPIFFSHLCLAYARKGDKQKTKEWAEKGLEAYEKYSGERVERIKENLEWYKSEDFPWKEFKEENEFEESKEDIQYK
ncbi:MAG: tetratricopeptide repeat protein [Candidatus Magasanikbacteria bacterium]